MSFRIKLIIIFLVVIAFVLASMITSNGEMVTLIHGRKTVNISQALALLKVSPNAAKWHMVMGANKITVFGKNEILVIEQDDVTIALSLKKNVSEEEQEKIEHDTWKTFDNMTDEEKGQHKEKLEDWYSAMLYYKDAGNKDKMIEMAELDIEIDIEKGRYSSASETAGEILNDPERAAELMKLYYERRINDNKTAAQKK